MIAPVKKSVNHPKTVASMRGTGWENNKFVLAASSQRFGSVKRSCFWLLLVPLVIGFFVLFRGNVELTFSFLLVLRLSLNAAQFTTVRTRPVNMFLDARPFDDLFLFRRPTNCKSKRRANPPIRR